MGTKELVNLYIEEQKAIASEFPFEETTKFCQKVIDTYDNGKSIYVMANGGNAGLMDNLLVDFYFHPFVSDNKGESIGQNVKKLKIFNLTSSPSIITGAMNDMGAENIFSHQLDGRVEKGDLLIGASGSGNSANIINAFELAKQAGADTVAITRGNGGKLKGIADLSIIIPGTSTFPGQVGGNDNNFHFEDYISSITHIAVGILQKHVRDKYGYKS